MGKRLSLGRVEVLIENLKRELSMQGSTIKGLGWVTTGVTGAGGTTNLSVSDNGTTFVVNTGGGAHTFNLPTPTIGLKFKFVASTTDSALINITSTSDGTSMAEISYGVFNVGTVPTSNEEGASAAASMGGNDHTAGDWVECVCDGTNWWFSGVAIVAGSLSFS